jgi:hypothetical protein
MATAHSKKRDTIDLIAPPPEGLRTIVLELRPGAVDLLVRGPDARRFLAPPIGAVLAAAIRQAEQHWRAGFVREVAGDDPTILRLEG